jgi:hypothetical protein
MYVFKKQRIVHAWDLEKKFNHVMHNGNENLG